MISIIGDKVWKGTIQETVLLLNYTYLLKRLVGVGPVDNRPSTDKLHHFVKTKKCDM